jgi:hypothetical protein
MVCRSIVDETGSELFRQHALVAALLSLLCSTYILINSLAPIHSVMFKCQTLTPASGKIRLLLCTPLNSVLLQSSAHHAQHLILVPKGYM